MLPTIWPVSWPLPATSRTSPAPSMRDAVRGWPRRGRRSRARREPPARISARIASGFSLRGLSSVTMRDVGLLDRDAAHDRPLALVAIAAAAEHADEAARCEGPQRIERRAERLGLVRIVDDDKTAAAPARRSRAGLSRPSALPWRRWPQPARLARRRWRGRPPPARCRPDSRPSSGKRSGEVAAIVTNDEPLRKAVGRERDEAQVLAGLAGSEQARGRAPCAAAITSAPRARRRH